MNDKSKDTMIHESPELVLMYHGKIYELNKTPFIIGRDPNLSDFCIDSKTVSRSHIRLTQTEGRWYLEDLHSSSGTILNGIKIDLSRKYEIVPNDCVELSDVSFDVFSVNNQQTAKTKEDELNRNVKQSHSDKSTTRKEVEIKTEKQMEKIDGNRSSKNLKPGKGPIFGKQIKKDDSPRELNHFKATIKQFLNENNLDQKGISRLKKIIELAHHLPKDELLIKNSVQAIVDDYLKKSTPVARTVQNEENSKIEGRKVPADHSQNRHTVVENENGHHQKYKLSDVNGSTSKPIKNKLNQNRDGTTTGLVFHPVKVEGDWIEIPVSKIPFTIGKGPENVDFVLHAAGISRSHCLVSFHDGFYHISDLGSTNGMSLNEKPLKSNKNYRIKNGDSVSFGVNQFYLEVP
ncbi:FHA domain-containing protein [Acetobacterium sp.]|uniref:FHA domain-containing protein n=1 Tax=Acetobacterium sp. TaxID=1872094 RepID=UPI002F3E3DCD